MFDYEEEIYEGDLLSELGVSQEQANTWVAEQDAANASDNDLNSDKNTIWQKAGSLIDFGFDSFNKYNFYSKGGTTIDQGKVATDFDEDDKDEKTTNNMLIIGGIVAAAMVFSVLIITMNNKT